MGFLFRLDLIQAVFLFQELFLSLTVEQLSPQQ
jgi:hypothetical protein